MDKNVLAAIDRLDEAIALFRIKKFDHALLHHDALPPVMSQSALFSIFKAPNWLFLSLLTETSTELYIKIQEITNLFSSERKKEILT
jgi:hypothetical protein